MRVAEWLDAPPIAPLRVEFTPAAREQLQQLGVSERVGGGMGKHLKNMNIV